MSKFNSIPLIPKELSQPQEIFLPDPNMMEWIMDTFIDPDGELANPEHEHLNQAYIGLLWTNTSYKSKGRVSSRGWMPNFGERSVIKMLLEYKLRYRLLCDTIQEVEANLGTEIRHDGGGKGIEYDAADNAKIEVIMEIWESFNNKFKS